jgi:hypothetical protein
MGNSSCEYRETSPSTEDMQNTVDRLNDEATWTSNPSPVVPHVIFPCRASKNFFGQMHPCKYPDLTHTSCPVAIWRRELNEGVPVAKALGKRLAAEVRLNFQKNKRG